VNKNKIAIYSDGGARGNPGPAACAFIVKTGEGIIQKSSKFLGEATNNVAEYSGATEALKWLSENSSVLKDISGPIEFYMDSELVVKQIIGDYKVKNIKLGVLNSEVLTLLRKIPTKILFINVPRSKNETADLLVNLELDKNV